MPRFAIVTPRSRHVHLTKQYDIRFALRFAGLLGSTNHAIVGRRLTGGGVGIVLAGSSLFAPTHEQNYFAMSGRLYAGDAVLYGFDHNGATIDIGSLPTPMWFQSAAEADAAIKAGDVRRPRLCVRGRPIWEWPGPRPQFVPFRARLAWGSP